MKTLPIETPEDLALAQKVLKIVKDFQSSIKKIKDDLYLLPNSDEIAYRLWYNIGRIKAYRGLLGYVVFEDNTILCVNSSSWVSQFDGCDEREVSFK